VRNRDPQRDCQEPDLQSRLAAANAAKSGRKCRKFAAANAARSGRKCRKFAGALTLAARAANMRRKMPQVRGRKCRKFAAVVSQEDQWEKPIEEKG
jgi:hypothetical protein